MATPNKFLDLTGLTYLGGKIKELISAHNTDTNPHENMNWLQAVDEEAANPVPLNADTLGGYAADYFATSGHTHAGYADTALSNVTDETFKAKAEAAGVGVGGGFVASDSAPSETNVLWIDTSGDAPLMRFWNGTEWAYIASQWYE